jgi:predicted dithiol-disulfide oxidoreductase (DUF899 family)
MHERRFPGESDDYRRVREELLAAEIDFRRQVETVAALRRALPVGGEVPVDYEFTEWDGRESLARTVRMSELFDDGKDTLFTYSFMFKPGPRGPLEVACPLCTSIIDGIDGAVPHIKQRINFAVVTKAPIERFNTHARARDWRNARLLSSAGTSFNADYNAETSDEDQFAMASVFTRDDGGAIHHRWSSELWFVAPEPGENPRHVDFMWPLWSVLDRTPAGRGSDWWPALRYD